MWYRIGKFVLKYRVILLITLLAITAFFGWQASQVQLSYEFSKAIPVSSQSHRDYESFRSRFGEDGSVLVLGINDAEFFRLDHFEAYRSLLRDIRQIGGVETILGAPEAVALKKSADESALISSPIFSDSAYTSQSALDSAAALFRNWIFYRGMLYNPKTEAWLAGITINKSALASADRSRVVNAIERRVAQYENETGNSVHLSGLPFIRTKIGDRVKNEMNYFLLGSILLATLTLILFFRSFSSVMLSLAVVITGVIWALATIHLLGFKITLLTALIPPLVIVIGIPNCIYFLNKYHMSWETYTRDKLEGASPKRRQAWKLISLVNMVGKMGIVTLFCNIAAAVGFAVFALTDSALLREFGIVAGINILALFFISLVIIPAGLSYMAPPKSRHTRYLRNRFLENILIRIEHWVVNNKKLVYAVTALLLLVSLAGMLRLHTVGFIVDDLPRKDVISTDLKWFEQNFGGVMPLEIEVDAGRRGAITRGLATFEKIDAFTDYLKTYPETGHTLSLVEGLKFARQAFYDGDSLNYLVPNEFDLFFLAPYLRGNDSAAGQSQLGRLTRSFMDSSRQRTRISVNMADVGTERLAVLLDKFKVQSDTIFNFAGMQPVNPEDPESPETAVFDSTYKITFTGSSVTYLEGSRYIINGLQESIFWAFLFIALIMLFLFRSFRILVCSLIPNVIPLIITAGLMGWTGVALKPSTVLVFSVALGIAIDVTIRFLVNYKQELPAYNHNVFATTLATIRHTGISIIYTSLVLIAGFIIFMFSRFGGTFALGWLTSLTLLTATFTNLVLLPVIMRDILPHQKEPRRKA